jgi:hypothetical protein
LLFCFLSLGDCLAHAWSYLAGKTLDLFVRWNFEPEDEAVEDRAK